MTGAPADQPQHLAEVERAFHEAAPLPAGERAAILDDLDPAVRAEVQSLLEHDDRPASIFQRVDSPVPTGQDAWAGERVAEPGTVAGPWRIIRPIGSGGMGTVYLAARDDGAYQKEVAVKLVRSGMSAAWLRRRFRQERQTLANLEHPNIARLLDGGVTNDGQPYLAMEYVEGRPIDEYCDERRLTIDERLELFRTVCGAVQHAHRNLVVHRDLKPGNVLVTSEGVPKLIDFGVAKMLGSEPEGVAAERTATLAGLLTPQYASPEQVRGEPVTTASDVYSLGILLYQLLTGRRPYDLTSRTAREMERLVCDQVPQRPSTVVCQSGAAGSATASNGDPPATIAAARRTTPARLRRRLQRDLDNVVMMALRKEPQRRYASVEQFAEDVRRCTKGLPVAARPDTLRYRAAKFAHRHRVAVPVAVLLAVALLASFAATAWQAAVASRQRDAAEASLRRAELVSAFLVDLFREADPYATGGGEPLTVGEILDRGAARLAAGLEEEPLVRAQLAHTMGLVYSNAGVYDRAAALLEEALDIRRNTGGVFSLEVATTLNDLGTVRRAAGDFEGAEAAHREALAMRQSKLGGSDPLVAQSLSNLGLALQSAGRYDEAEPLLHDAVALRRALPDGEPAELAASCNNLAGLLFSQGDYVRAATLLREALAIKEDEYGDQHPEVARGLHNLAFALHAQGEHDAAEPLYRQSLSIRRRTLGDRHPDTARSLNNLGGLLVEQEQCADAEPLFREVLAIFRETFGPEHPDTARTVSNLGFTLFCQGRHSEAETLLDEALQVQLRSRPGAHPEIATTRVRLAETRCARGRSADAEENAREALAINRQRLPEGHWLTAEAESVLGVCLMKQGRFEEAEPLLMRGYEVIRDTHGADDRRVIHALRRLEDLRAEMGSAPRG